MTQTSSQIRSCINWGGPVVVPALAALVLLALLSGTPVQTALPVQPLLRELAQAQPDAAVPVIVLKTEAKADVEGEVLRLGGTVTRDLSMIKAFAAEIPAQRVAELARTSGVRWVSYDAQVHRSSGELTPAAVTSAFIQTVGADRAWSDDPVTLQGQGVTVAVVDSGDCQNCVDLNGLDGQTRTLAAMSVLTGPGDRDPDDRYGHGSLIEGVVGNSGVGSGGKYMGVAPGVNLVSVKIANSLGESRTSDVVTGLQWVLDHKDVYGIRVVNLSLNGDLQEDYNTSPLDAACEILWFNGIVVVVPAGNTGTGGLYPPANDPFVITVGATDDKGTAALADDEMASFSASGIIGNGLAKPELVAPGTNIVSFVPRTKNKIYKDHAANRTGESAVNENYMRVSGTSFSAPIVSGAAALLLQREPALNPDQIKYRLMSTANKDWPGYRQMDAGAGYLDVYAAVHAQSLETANTGLPVSFLLTTGSTPVHRLWGSVNWSSVNWSSVNWSSVNWSSVNWSSVNWSSDYWGN